MLNWKGGKAFKAQRGDWARDSFPIMDGVQFVQGAAASSLLQARMQDSVLIIN